MGGVVKGETYKMTCLLSSYCTKADGCTNHIGVDIERCSAFERKPLTNMEWIQSASTEELAELLFHIFGQGVIFGETHEEVPMFPDDEVVTVSVFDWWLKEIHN